MRTTTRRILATTISAAVLMSACSSGDDDADATTTVPTTSAAPATTAAPDTTTTTAAPTTTAATTSTTEPTPPTTEPAPTTTEPPPTTNPGDPDWVAVVQALLETLHDINETPDTARVDEFCLAGENDCQATIGEDVGTFVENGWRTRGVPKPVVVTAELTATADDQPVSEALWVLVRATTAPEDLEEAAIVDENGEVVFNIVSDEPDQGEVLDLYLIQGVGGWRVLGLTTVG